MAYEEDRERLLYWCKGNQDAADLCAQFLYVCHVWDDLVDHDTPREASHINQAFWMAFVEIPTNKFYRTFFSEIHPVLVDTINQWEIANTLEHSGDEHQRTISFTLRLSILGLICHIAFLVGGYEWVRTIGAEIRMYGQRETLNEYLEELQNA